MNSDHARSLILHGKSLLLVGAVCALAAGCVRYHPKPISPIETAARLDARRLSDEDLRRFIETNRAEFATEWPRKTWGLEQLTLAALYYQPAIALARADWRTASAAIETARGRPNPTVTAGPGYNFNAKGATPWLPFASLDWPIETAGKRGRRIEQARFNSDAALLNLLNAAWKARSQVRAALLDGTSARLRERSLDEQVQLQEQTLVFLEQRRKAGAMSAAELTPARLALQKLRLDRTDARRQNSEARARLAEALGVPGAALDEIELKFDMTNDSGAGEKLSATEARQRALTSRVDVLQAMSEYAASEAGLHLETAKQYPDVHLNPGYQLDDGKNKAAFGVSVELPVLNRNQGPIGEAKARRAAAAARIEAIQAGVIADVDRATATFRVAETSLSEAEQFVAVQRKQVEAIEQQYKAGGADRVDLLAAQLDLAASEAAVLDGQTKRQQAVGALEDALQRPLDGFEPKVSALTQSADEHDKNERSKR
jgi:outer membrane protein TolC